MATAASIGYWRRATAAAAEVSKAVHALVATEETAVDKAVGAHTALASARDLVVVRAAAAQYSKHVAATLDILMLLLSN
jgi:hypothetical protein